jgi:hypothetical protein
MRTPVPQQIRKVKAPYNDVRFRRIALPHERSSPAHRLSAFADYVVRDHSQFDGAGDGFVALAQKRAFAFYCIVKFLAESPHDASRVSPLGVVTGGMSGLASRKVELLLGSGCA